MLFLTHCQKTSHSFWNLPTAQQQGTHFDIDRIAGQGYTLLTLVFRLRNEVSVPSLLQTWDVLAKRHQSPASRALKHCHSPLQNQNMRVHAHCTHSIVSSACRVHKPSGFCLSQITCASLHTSPHPLRTQAVFPLSLQKAHSASCSSTNRNLNYGCD